MWLLLGNTAKMTNESIFHCQNCVEEVSFETMQDTFEKYQENNEDACFQSLKSHNKKRQTPVHVAAYAGRTDVLSLLFEKLPDSAHGRR